MIDLVLHATLPETNDGRQSDKNTHHLFLVTDKGFDHRNVKNLWNQRVGGSSPSERAPDRSVFLLTPRVNKPTVSADMAPDVAI